MPKTSLIPNKLPELAKKSREAAEDTSARHRHQEEKLKIELDERNKDLKEFREAIMETGAAIAQVAKETAGILVFSPEFQDQAEEMAAKRSPGAAGSRS